MVEYAVGARAQRHRRRRVQPDGRDARRSRVPGRRGARGARGRRAHDQHARHGRLRAARAGGGADRAALRSACPSSRRRSSRSTARTTSGSRPRTRSRRSAPGARQVELAVNGIGERAGNTAFEEVVMAIAVHGAALGVHTGVDPRGICALSALVERAQRGRGAAEQGGGRRECVPPRVGHPPGRRAQVARELRGARPGGDRPRARHARSCWASSPGAPASSRARGSSASASPTRALDAAFERFQRLADGKPVVEDDDLRSICARRLSGSRGARPRRPPERGDQHVPRGAVDLDLVDLRYAVAAVLEHDRDLADREAGAVHAPDHLLEERVAGRADRERVDRLEHARR